MSESNWSVPEQKVLQSVKSMLDTGREGVIATIIGVEGNAYRRPGAKMVLPKDGEGIGNITAGCLEGEVKRLAEEVFESGERRVESYDLRPGRDDVWGLGVGCNGIIEILLEPLEESLAPVLERYDRGLSSGIVTVIESNGEVPVGSRAYYEPEERTYSDSETIPMPILEELEPQLTKLIEKGRGETYTLDGITLFADGVRAPDHLVLVGTGHDIAPIAEVGSLAGFEVSVVGFRGATATIERFPMADDVRSTSPARIRNAIDLDPSTYVVLATHNFVDDRLALEEVLESPVPYIGLMGPHERFGEMLDEFRKEGRTVNQNDMERIHTPVGLSLGGGSPYEIAISVIAEVMAISNKRVPGHLRDREGPIHERMEASLDSE